METETIAAPVYEARCSFCRKPQADVETLIAAVGVSICNECVDVANEALRQRGPVKERVRFDPVEHLRTFDNEKLLSFVARIEPLYQDVAGYQALYVDILRQRGVSWADVGQSLGVSRQAAWKRFAKGPEAD
jgi:hypothetical protein